MPQPTTISVDTLTPKIRNVTFSNPPVNLVGPGTLVRLLEVVEELGQDAQVQVVIFTSSTPGYFFNHVDLGQIAESRRCEVGTRHRRGSTSWCGCPRPRSSASHRSGDGHGAAATSSPSPAIFVMPAVSTRCSVNQRSRAGSCRAVVAVNVSLDSSDGIGLSKAIISRYDYDAEQAERYGWVTRAIADAELDDFVGGLASRIASFDRTAVAAAKAQINRASLPPVADLKAAYEEFSESVTWPGFQARMPRFRELIAQMGLDDVELHLGDYLGLANQRA